MKLLVLVFGFLFCFSALAQSYSVEKLNEGNTRVILKAGSKGTLNKGDFLVFSDEFDQDCKGKVVKSTSEGIVLDISKCKNAKSVKVGSEFKPPKDGYVPQAYQDKKRDLSLPTANEDWYFQFGLGFSSATYNDSIQNTVDALQNNSSVDQSTINFDMLGFYWPLDNHTAMHGVSYGGVTDTFSGPGGTFTILHYLLAYSYYKYFGANIGDGWFLRGEVGMARFVIVLDTVVDISETSDWGLGFQAGGGYSWAIGEETRMPIGLYLSSRKAKGDDDYSSTTANVTVSFLF